MEWIAALVKHFTVSRVFTGAVFITSGMLIIGPRWLPDYLDPPPKELSIFIVTALIFSGALLCIWFVVLVWKGSVAGTSRVARQITLRLDADERLIMLALADLSPEPISFDSVQYDKLKMSKLEVFELCNGLRQKGLVSLGLYQESVHLTGLGRKYALKIQREAERSK